MIEEFEILKLEDEHFDLLVPLYKKAFGKNVDADFLRKKFDTSSFSKFKNIGFVAITKSNKAIAFYGVLPCFMIRGDKEILVAQSGDTMVDFDYRRKKLFVKLAERTFEYCKELGFDAVFGFPNIYSFPSFVKKLNWIHYHNVVAYHKRVRCIPLLRIAKFIGIGVLEKYHKIVLKLISTSSRGFVSILKNNDHFTLSRSKSFMNYKSYHDNFVLKIKGVKVWVKPSPMYLYIGDIETSDNKILKEVIKGLQNKAFWLGIPHLRLQMSKDTLLEGYAKQTFEKLDNEYPFGGLSFNKEVPLEDFRFTLADYDTF